MGRPAPRRGEIWWVYTPGQPYDPHQPRPALVVSEDIRNRLSDDFIVIPIFSAGTAGPTHVPIPAGTGGLAHNSLLFCEEITTIYEGLIADGPLGEPVPEHILDAVLRAVRRALGEVIPEA